MTTSQPLYSVGDEVYLQASASIGMLEPIFITGLYHRGGSEWMYTFRTGTRKPHSQHKYGNRQSLVVGQALYLSEDEIVTKCEAFVMAEAVALANYQKIRSVRETFCPENPTEG